MTDQERETWWERLEASLVHLGDYEPADTVQNARDEAREVGTSLAGSRAETGTTEQNARTSAAGDLIRAISDLREAARAAADALLRPVLARLGRLGRRGAERASWAARSRGEG